MNVSKHNFVNDLRGSIRCCPFCAGTAHIAWVGFGPLLYGIQCRSCAASIPAIHPKSQAAILAWNRRSGLAALGGQATGGKCSGRKLVTARRNLKKACQARQVDRLRQGGEAAFNALQPYRAQEMAESEAAVANDRAWLQKMEPLILADPVLRELHDLLPHRNRAAENSEADAPL